MMSTWGLLTWPFRALGRLVTLLMIPAALGALTWFLAQLISPWLFIGTVLCGLWALITLYLWWLQIMGRLHSLDRGAIRIRRSRDLF